MVNYMKYLSKLLFFLIISLLLISCHKSELITPKLASTNIDTINQLLKNKQDLILYLGKDSCQACQKITPILIEVSQQLNLDFLNKYNITEVPALLIINNNQMYFPKVTYDKDQLIKLLKILNPRP